MAIDSAGNLYIADTGNHVIRKVSASGTITTVAGNNAQGYSGDNGLATNATLDTPTGVAVDSGGDLFIADTNNNRIRKVDTSGTISTVVGNGTEGYTGDGGPATSATLNKPAAVVRASFIVEICGVDPLHAALSTASRTRGRRQLLRSRKSGSAPVENQAATSRI